MEIRKGPYGHFAIEKIGSIDSVSEYSREIISENILGHMLPVYINPSAQGYELYYDYSGLKPIKDKKPATPDEINHLRACLGDLFLTFSLMPDHLLAPSSVILDERYVFIDDEYKDIHICFNPNKSSPEKLSISSLTDAGIRSFLESDALSGVIKQSETDQIVYALQTNDETLFIKAANNISVPIKEEKSGGSLLKSYDFLRCIVATIASLAFLIIGYNVPSIILVLIAVALAVKTYIQFDLKKKSSSKTITEDNSNTEMLFDNKNYSNVITCLVLTSEDKDGNKTCKSIYTDKATIGSDRFLCDIFIDDEDISAIHTEIKRINKAYFIRDLSSDNSTYLDNVRLEPQRDYEIKSGQTLICGQIEYQIDIL